MRLALLSCIVLLVITLATAEAHAESVVWNRSYQTELYSTKKVFGEELWFENPNVSVQYRARMENPDTGAIIPNGASIPVGSRVRFVFDQHVYSDISWFGTGGAFDSPYGDWTEAASPPPVACHEKDYVGKDERKKYQGDLYVALAVNPPAKSLTGVDAFSCDAPDASGSRDCTARQPGTYDPIFTFGVASEVDVPAASDEITGDDAHYDFFSASSRSFMTSFRRVSIVGTYGYFYPRFKKTTGQCAGNNDAMTSDDKSHVGVGPAFAVQVPVKSIPFTLNVIPAPENPDAHMPSAPSLQSNVACTVGTPHSITMTSTDPDGDSLRYGIDWDADGSVNEWVPPSGYVPSGTSQSASRTYATAGEKTVKVMAQDEGGLSSDWAMLTFSCAETPPPASQCSDTSDNDGDGLIDSLDPDCTATAGLSEFPQGQQGPSPSPSSLDGVLDLRVLPSLVRAGSTTRVNWSAQNVQTCAVTGTNGDSWSGLQSRVGGESSSPITAETRYTLSCTDLLGATLTKQATVRTIPSWRER